MSVATPETRAMLDESLQQHHESLADDHYSVYAFYNKTLRAWLAAYSVGVPAFLFTKAPIFNWLITAHAAYRVVLAFAAAITLQVALTVINKYTQWAVYLKYWDPKRRWKVTQKLMDWCETISMWIWIDFLLDAGTIGLLTYGTVMAFGALVKH